MSAAQPLAWPSPSQPGRRYTEAEYLAFDERAAGRWEFFDGRITPVGRPDLMNQLDPSFMAGATPTHVRLSRKLAGLLFQRLPLGCEALQSDLRVHIPLTGGYTYPDTVIVCGDLEFADPEAAVPSLTNPVVVVEILSESTAEHDRFGKFARYRSIPALRQYIMLDSRRPQVEVLNRQADDSWTYEALTQPAEVIRFASGDCSISLAELYEGLLHFTAEEVI
ncbi:Uma2 family endonuclease [uncultured Hymenobacter sp.]|uniref:Uma2 family endonuclease n=1 Tax=uncultured Hymenobacter sp. TaxID=170016 RepID=UPI0035CC5510